MCGTGRPPDLMAGFVIRACGRVRTPSPVNGPPTETVHAILISNAGGPVPMPCAPPTSNHNKDGGPPACGRLVGQGGLQAARPHQHLHCAHPTPLPAPNPDGSGAPSPAFRFLHRQLRPPSRGQQMPLPERDQYPPRGGGSASQEPKRI